MDIRKTGMGSSAALTTSFVGCILQFFGIINLQHHQSDHFSDTDPYRTVLHNLSQLIHARAQGKIGSGFDIAASVYGSVIYQRFEPLGLQPCMEESCDASLLYAAVHTDELWYQLTIQPFHLPAGIDIIMGDVCGGSSSTSMVI